MSKPSHQRFLDWVVANGGEPLERRGRFEWARFRARSVLCIIFMDQNGQVSRMDPALAGEAYRLWRDHKGRERMGMEGGEEAAFVEDWKATGRALIALGERAKAGAVLNIEHEAAALGIPADRLVRSLRAQRAPVPEQTHG